APKGYVTVQELPLVVVEAKRWTAADEQALAQAQAQPVERNLIRRVLAYAARQGLQPGSRPRRSRHLISASLTATTVNEGLAKAAVELLQPLRIGAHLAAERVHCDLPHRRPRQQCVHHPAIVMRLQQRAADAALRNQRADIHQPPRPGRALLAIR